MRTDPGGILDSNGNQCTHSPVSYVITDGAYIMRRDVHVWLQPAVSEQLSLDVRGSYKCELAENYVHGIVHL